MMSSWQVDFLEKCQRDYADGRTGVSGSVDKRIDNPFLCISSCVNTTNDRVMTRMTINRKRDKIVTLRIIIIIIDTTAARNVTQIQEQQKQ